MKFNNFAVPNVPGLLQRPGKRKTMYYAKPMNKYVPLGHDLDAAIDAFKKMMELPNESRPIDVENMCKAYIAEQRKYIKQGNIEANAKSTVDDYETSFLKHIIPHFGRFHPDAITGSHIAAYLKVNREANRGVRANREKAALSSAFKFGMAEGFAKSNPCYGVARNTERPRTRGVSVTEFNEFLQHAHAKGGSSYMVACIGATVALTGRRRAEILNLTKAAMRPEGFIVGDSKNQKRRYLVEWSPTLKKVVTEATTISRWGSTRGRVETIYLFGTADEGTPYTDSGFKGLWNRLMHSYVGPEGTGSEKWFHAHDLRSLYVSEMLDQDRDPETHGKKATMSKVYDRRPLIRVAPLA
ncbi:MAG: tyrosine-type recombinase/integrase [Limnohabitans sp.]|jgi:integrase